MKLAKKTISVALAGIMAVSSLAVGTSVFAADEKVNELKSATSASATFKSETVTGKTDVYENTLSLYSYKPSATGLYDVTLSTSPYVLTKDAYMLKAGSTTEWEKVYDKGTRLDSAKMLVFTLDDTGLTSTQVAKLASDTAKAFKDGSALPSTATTVVTYSDSFDHVATGYNVTDGLTYTDLAKTEQKKLDSKKTYYIAAVANKFDYFKADPYNDRVIGERKDGAPTTGTFKIAKTDWKYTDVSTTKDVTGTSPLLQYKELKSSVEYVGESNTIVMPDEYPANYKAITITGEADKNVTSVKLGKNCENMNLIVKNKKKLVSFIYNDGIKSIGPNVFEGCTALKTIVVPKSVETIGDGAFSGCVNLASITLNEGLKTVGNRAFYDTAALAVKVPSTVTSIGTEAFGYIEADNNFYPDPYNHDYLTIVNPKFVLGGTTDYVKMWAQKNDVPYVDLTNGCTHHYISYVKVAPTFFSTGSIVKACGFCGVSTTQVLPKTKPAIKAVKSTGKGKIKVYANKTAGVSGYQIKVSTSKKFTKKTTKVVTVKERDSLRKTVKGLKRGKKVYVKIRAYKKSGSSKTYSAFSPVKTVKVK